MNQRRPLAVTIVGCVYIATGAIGFAAHVGDLRVAQFDGVGVESIRLLALVAGIFLLLGQNWARWLAGGWMAVHVVLSVFHGWGQVAVHCVFLAAVAWLLFRPQAARYFGGTAG